MEITSEIVQVGGEGFTSPRDAAVYLIRLQGQSALIDSGCGFQTDRLIENIQAANVEPKQVQLILMTHCHFDHTGGANELRDKLGCKIIAHELDAAFMESGDDIVTAASWYNATMPTVKVDRKLSQAEESIHISGRDITAIHIPGHSPGSVVYLIESEGKRVLFGQDVHGPLHPSLRSNEMDYKNSLKKLITLDADILCEGHFGVIKGNKRVIDFINSYL